MASYARGRDALKVAGLSVLAVIAFFVLFAWMTNRGLSIRQSDVYVAIASADGLRKGDPVVFRGVTVGEVRTLRFHESGSVVVRAHLLERVPLTRSAFAELVPIDLFGRQSLVLRDGRHGDARLRSGDTIRAQPPASLTNRMSELGARAESLLTEQNIGLVQHALASAAQAATQVGQLSSTLERAVAAQQQSLSAVLQEIGTLAHNAARATDTAAVASLRADVARSVQGLERLTFRLDTAVVAFASVADALREGGGTSSLLLHDPRLYQQTVDLLASMDALVRDLKANPGRYVKFSVF